METKHPSSHPDFGLFLDLDLENHDVQKLMPPLLHHLIQPKHAVQLLLVVLLLFSPKLIGTR
jgi:hypothetical protein